MKEREYQEQGIYYCWEFPYSIEEGIANNQFYFDYQPIVSCTTYKIKKVEALARWKIDDKIIYPNSFFPIARGLDIEDLDRHLFELAIADSVKFIPYEIDVHINLSPQQLHKGFVKSYIKQIPSNAVLEITEEEFFLDEYVPSFELIKKNNIPVGIDDFGCGCWSLERMAHLDVDFIKLDKVIVSRLNMPHYFDLVQCLMNYFKETRKLQVTAEFIEDKKTADLCCRLGVDFLQGFYFEKPQSFETLITKLSQPH